MFVKLTRSGTRRYVQLVESYRDEAGKPRQRTIATVGRVDETGGGVDSLLSGLLRATGRAAVDAPSDTPEASPEGCGIRFDSSLAFGDVFALDRLWHELGFNEITGLLRPARLSFDAEALVRAMVFNRLCDVCDATSKLGLLRWLQTTWLPGVDPVEVTHQRLLRTMDALQCQADAVASLALGQRDHPLEVAAGLPGRVLHARAQRQPQAKSVGAQVGRQRAVAVHARAGHERGPYSCGAPSPVLGGAAVVHREGVQVQRQPAARQHAVVGPLAAQQPLIDARMCWNNAAACASNRWRSVGLDASSPMPSASLRILSPR